MCLVCYDLWFGWSLYMLALNKTKINGSIIEPATRIHSRQVSCLSRRKFLHEEYNPTFAAAPDSIAPSMEGIVVCICFQVSETMETALFDKHDNGNPHNFL